MAQVYDSFDEFVRGKFSLDTREISALAQTMPEHSLMAAGSGVLHFLVHRLTQGWESNDLDLYINDSGKANELMAILERQGYSKTSSFADEYAGGFMVLNNIRNITTFKNAAGETVQVVLVGMPDLHYTIDKFDLTVCSVGVDFKTGEFYMNAEAKVDIPERKMHIRDAYVNKFSKGNFILHRRVAKYEQRGFALVNRPPYTKALASLRNAMKRVQQRIDKAEDFLALAAFKTEPHYRGPGWGKRVWQFGMTRSYARRLPIERDMNDDGTISVRNRSGNVYDDEDDALAENDYTKVPFGVVLRQIIGHETIILEQLNAIKERLKAGHIDITASKRQKYEDVIKYLKFRVKRELLELARYGMNQLIPELQQEYAAMDDQDPEKPLFLAKLNYFISYGPNMPCSNQDDVDFITQENIANIPPDNIFRRIIFTGNPQNPVRIICYEADSLFRWVNLSRNQNPFPRYGSYPNDRSPLSAFDWSVLDSIAGKRRLIERIGAREDRIERLEFLLANIKQGSVTDQMQIRGGAMPKKIVKKKSVKRSAKKKSAKKSSKKKSAKKSPKRK